MKIRIINPKDNCVAHQGEFNNYNEYLELRSRFPQSKFKWEVIE